MGQTQVHSTARIIDPEEKQFTADIEALGTSNEKTKIAMQRAIRYVTKRIVYNYDVTPANRLQDRLDLMDSKHYARRFRAYLCAFCGDMIAESDGNVNRFYMPEKPSIIFSKAKGDKGWKILPAYKESAGKTRGVYELYLTNAIFMTVKILPYQAKINAEKSREEKIIEKVTDRAKDIIDTVNALINAQDLWSTLDTREARMIKAIHEVIKNTK